jgi:hypothetical protein
MLRFRGSSGIRPRAERSPEDPPGHAQSLRRFPPQRVCSLAGHLHKPADICRTLLGVLDVERSAVQPLRVVTKLTEATVAVEAEDPTHTSGRVIVVDVFWIGPIADGAHITLLADQVLDLGRADPIAPLQVVVTRAPVQPLTRFITSRVVTGLAVRGKAVLGPAVSREFGKRFVLLAVRTALHT